LGTTLELALSLVPKDWTLVIRVEQGSYFAVFEIIEGKLLCLIFNFEAGRQSYIGKNISVWGINISLRVIELPEKKGSYSAVF
jgi:hypothetical protein